jgi:hypothetical protein
LGEAGSVPEVVEKGIGISYPIGKPTNRKGGYTDEERIPQGTGIDHVRAGVIAGRVERPTTGNNILAWQSTGMGGQFLENISLRNYAYPAVYDFELDWGAAISQAGSVWNSLDFYGTIWDRNADTKAVFDPSELGYLKFTKIN